MTSKSSFIKPARKDIACVLGPHSETEATIMRIARRVVSTCFTGELEGNEGTQPSWLDKDLVIAWLSGDMKPIVRELAEPEPERFHIYLFYISFSSYHFYIPSTV